MRILVLEDEPALLQLYTEALVDAGHEVLAAADGAQGIALLEHEPDLILVDLMMPVMDGYQFLRQLRASEHRDTPAIVVSAVATSAWSQQVGANGYLAKPFDNDVLVATVQRFAA